MSLDLLVVGYKKFIRRMFIILSYMYACTTIFISNHCRIKIEGCIHVYPIEVPVIYYRPFQGGASVVVYSICQCSPLSVFL